MSESIWAWDYDWQKAMLEKQISLNGSKLPMHIPNPKGKTFSPLPSGAFSATPFDVVQPIKAMMSLGVKLVLSYYDESSGHKRVITLEGEFMGDPELEGEKLGFTYPFDLMTACNTPYQVLVTMQFEAVEKLAWQICKAAGIYDKVHDIVYPPLSALAPTPAGEFGEFVIGTPNFSKWKLGLEKAKEDLAAFAAAANTAVEPADADAEEDATGQFVAPVTGSYNIGAPQFVGELGTENVSGSQNIEVLPHEYDVGVGTLQPVSAEEHAAKKKAWFAHLYGVQAGPYAATDEYGLPKLKPPWIT